MSKQEVMQDEFEEAIFHLLTPKGPLRVLGVKDLEKIDQKHLNKLEHLISVELQERMLRRER